jgi:Mor family transcriptional regulator
MSDIVTRIVERVQQIRPELSAADVEHLEFSLRLEFGGEQVYIRARRRANHELTHEIRRRFNGRNARQIARILGVGKTTVYRILRREGLIG